MLSAATSGMAFNPGDRRMAEILTTDQAAAHLALGRSTLEKWRVWGTGPKFIKLGLRRVGYHKTDLDEWISARPRHASTSQVETLRGPGRPRKQTPAAA
jgi:predicted DNA-binding transcriptional regulator AlpA